MTPLQIAVLIGFNLVLLILAIVAFRLIGGRPKPRQVESRADDLFSFDSWSDGGQQGASQPAASAGRPRPRNGF